VLHSLGLTGHESKLWGEIDLVVLSTKGIFAIEVKAGRSGPNRIFPSQHVVALDSGQRLAGRV